MDTLRTPSAADYDRAWEFIQQDDTLKAARSRLSIDQLRKIIRHCANAFTGAGIVDALRHKDELPKLKASDYETSLRETIYGKT